MLVVADLLHSHVVNDGNPPMERSHHYSLPALAALGSVIANLDQSHGAYVQRAKASRSQALASGKPISVFCRMSQRSMMLAGTCRAALSAKDSGPMHAASRLPISLIRSSVPATLNSRQTSPEICNSGRYRFAVPCLDIWAMANRES